MNMSFKKEAFAFCQFSENLRISKGVHELVKIGLVGDDTEFSLKLRKETGRSILYDPSVRVRHNVYGYRLTPRFIWRQDYSSICALNEERDLPYISPKIPQWIDEILLVDGQPTDSTVEVVKELQLGQEFYGSRAKVSMSVRLGTSDKVSSTSL